MATSDRSGTAAPVIPLRPCNAAESTGEPPAPVRPRKRRASVPPGLHLVEARRRVGLDAAHEIEALAVLVLNLGSVPLQEDEGIRSQYIEWQSRCLLLRLRQLNLVVMSVFDADDTTENLQKVVHGNGAAA